MVIIWKLIYYVFWVQPLAVHFECFLSLLGVNQSLFKDTVHCYSWSEQQ